MGANRGAQPSAGAPSSCLAERFAALRKQYGIIALPEKGWDVWEDMQAEIDRADNLNRELLEALERLYGICRYAAPEDNKLLTTQWHARMKEAEAAIAKARKQ